MLIETHTAIDAIWGILTTKFLLKQSTLRIGTIKHSDITIGDTITIVQATYFITHDTRFFLIRISYVQMHLLAITIFAKHFLAYLALVIDNNAVSSFHYSLRRTIVLL